MKIIKFEDMSRQIIQVSLSSGNDYRVYINPYINPEADSSPCMLLNKYQAKILINALEDFMGEYDVWRLQRNKRDKSIF